MRGTRRRRRRIERSEIYSSQSTHTHRHTSHSNRSSVNHHCFPLFASEDQSINWTCSTQAGFSVLMNSVLSDYVRSITSDHSARVLLIISTELRNRALSFPRWCFERLSSSRRRNTQRISSAPSSGKRREWISHPTAQCRRANERTSEQTEIYRRRNSDERRQSEKSVQR